MTDDSLDYPKQFKFADLLTHYVSTRVSALQNFRCGDWLRFLHDDYLDTLSKALESYNHLAEGIQQDLTLTCQLLVTHESQNVQQITSARLITAVATRLTSLTTLELRRRLGHIFIEQRASILPGAKLDVHTTVKGQRAEASGLLPSPSSGQTGEAPAES